MAEAKIPDAEAPAKPQPKVRKKRVKRSVPHARACIHAGENNTIVTLTASPAAVKDLA